VLRWVPEAASCWWLPFAPSPMAGRNAETEGRAGSREKRVAPEKAEGATKLDEGTDETSKPAKPGLGEPPFGFSSDENVGPRKKIVVNDKKGAAKRMTEMILDLGRTHSNIYGDDIAAG
jgi:hypothetical protein